MATKNANGEDSILQQNAPVIYCWACRTLVQVPYHQGKLASEFKCGWCHAVSSYGPDPRRSKKQRSSKCARILTQCVSYSAVIVVVLLLSSMMGLGFSIVLPHIVLKPISLAVHRTIVAIMSANILFNYFACSLRSPGIPNSVIPSVTDVEGRWHMPQGACDNYRFCHQCQNSKPPGTHHCSICGKCIADMDHHCPFIGNCVGRANLRCFLVFLIWALVGTLYAAVMTGRLLIRDWDEFSARRRGFRGIPVMGLMFVDLTTAPGWFLAAGYIFMVSIGTFLGMGVLFHSQMMQVLSGRSYISSLKGVAADEKGSRMVRLSKVFGNGHPITWLLPRWSDPRERQDAAGKAF
ncbi:hypothetical protein BSKO_04221 [Bryopsis sp. KO-2023]|nr:hypothetical protein BSKO_04221 [Bryopsis sp. KO-2023]